MPVTFDNRPGMTFDPGDAQLYASEGVTPDEFENCTFAVTRATMADYGNGRPLDCEQMRQAIAPGSHTGEPWSVSVRLVQSRPDLYPNCPPITVEWPDDPAAAIRAYGAQGFIVHWAGWCSAQAEILVPPDARIVASHAERVGWADETYIYSWNPWTGYIVQLTDVQLNAAYDGGGIVVFHRSVLSNAAPAAPVQPDYPLEDDETELNPRDIAAGKLALYPGAIVGADEWGRNVTTDLNLAAATDCNVGVFAFDPSTGRVLGHCAITLTGNKPDVTGPVEASLDLESALGVTGPFTLGLIGSADFTAYARKAPRAAGAGGAVSKIGGFMANLPSLPDAINRTAVASAIGVLATFVAPIFGYHISATTQADAVTAIVVGYGIAESIRAALPLAAQVIADVQRDLAASRPHPAAPAIPAQPVPAPAPAAPKA